MPKTLLALALMLTPTAASVASAQLDVGQTDDAREAELDRRAVGVYRDTQSPFCPGRTLDDCPSASAAEWRRDIRAWLAEGEDAREIRRRLEARAPGFDLSGRVGVPGWLFALAGFGLGGLLVARHVRRRGVASAPSAPLDASDDAALEARLDAELARLER